jgi:hypothetical protein
MLLFHLLFAKFSKTRLLYSCIGLVNRYRFSKGFYIFNTHAQVSNNKQKRREAVVNRQSVIKDIPVCVKKNSQLFLYV